MICTFFGHRDAPSTITSALKSTIMHLIQAQNVKTFYVGNNGRFDLLVQAILKDISAQTNIRYSIIISHINEQALSDAQNATVFPEGLETVPPKYAIAKRNAWLIENSSMVIAYAIHTHSNCHSWIEKAKRKGLQIINLADCANKKEQA